MISQAGSGPQGEEAGRPPRTLGVLLAAGGGRRYGMPKALAEGGRWLAAGLTALKDGGCDDVLVVLGAADQGALAAAGVALPDGVTAVQNDAWAAGMATSVSTALAAATRSDADLLVLHLVDLPDVPAAVVARLRAAANAQALSATDGERAVSSLVRASYDGVPGHPVLAGRAHWSGMAEACVGDRGAAAYLDGHPSLALLPCGDLAAGRDIDHSGPARP